MQSLWILVIFTLLTGIIYPLVVTGLAQLFFHKQANGSLIVKNKRIVGSELIGQSFTNERYFQGRPSANGYDAMNSGGYNFGPSSSNLIYAVRDRAAQVRKDDSLQSDTLLPPDMVLSSASGLDPDISPANAYLQAGRIARARNLNDSLVIKLIDKKKSRSYTAFGVSPL